MKATWKDRRIVGAFQAAPTEARLESVYENRGSVSELKAPSPAECLAPINQCVLSASLHDERLTGTDAPFMCLL